MTGINLSRAEWRKSSYSGQSGNCVEVARNLPGLVAVRDSKKPDGAKLVISREAWRAFLKGVRPSGSAYHCHVVDPACGMAPLKTWRLMPGDVHDVHRRLTRSRDPERLTCERIDCPARLVPGDIQAGHADPPVLGDAHDTQVEQGVVQRAQRQRVRYLVRALLAMPADVRRLDPDRVAAERTIEPAHRTATPEPAGVGGAVAVLGVTGQVATADSVLGRPHSTG